MSELSISKQVLAEEIAEIYSFKESKFKIYETYNYDVFTFIDMNRNVDQTRVKKIAEEILKNGLLFAPIIVNEKLEIIEGQHRVKAIISLNEMGYSFPIYFSIQPGYNSKEMITFNKNLDKWKKRDYLKHYVEIGSEAYIEFNNFLDTFPWLPQTGAEAIFAMNQNGINNQQHQSIDGTDIGRRKTFEDGDMKVPVNIDYLYEVAGNIEKIGEFYDGFNRAHFIRCMISLIKMEGFEFKRFLKKLKGSAGAKYPLQNVGSVEHYRERINLIYNHSVPREKYLELRLPSNN